MCKHSIKPSCMYAYCQPPRERYTLVLNHAAFTISQCQSNIYNTNIHISQLLWCPRSPQSPPTAFQPTAPPTQLPATNLASLTYQHLRMLLQQNPLDASKPLLSPLNPNVTYCCLGQRFCMSLLIHFPHHSALYCNHSRVIASTFPSHPSFFSLIRNCIVSAASSFTSHSPPYTLQPFLTNHVNCTQSIPSSTATVTTTANVLDHCTSQSEVAA